MLAKAPEVEKLKVQLARLRRMQFGRSSEKIDREIDQLELALEDLETAAAAEGMPAVSTEPRASSPEPRAQAGRRKLPEHLPCTEIMHVPHDACPSCGGALRQVGEDVREVLDYILARFAVIRHIRPAVSCRCCESMVQAPIPSLPIERGLPSAGLLAHVLIAKYCDHLPLYRQSAIYAREGVELERSLLAEAIARHVLSSSVLHADDTPVPVLDPGRGKTKTGRLWGYLRDERPHAGQDPPAVLYRYTPDRKGEHPQRELAGFRRHLHADGYAGFDALYEAAGGRPAAVAEVACMAHVRRKFFDEARPNRLTPGRRRAEADREAVRHRTSPDWPTGQGNAAGFAKWKPGLFSMNWPPSLTPPWRAFPARATWPRQSATPARAGRH
ncbi:Mobile element protein [Azospirillum doebereinerae]